MAHILLVEPDRLLANSYRQALRTAGHQVTACLTGQGAIQAADQAMPDVIVLELQLKGHNGVEFLYELRSYPEWQHLPVIVQTMVPQRELANLAAVPLLGISHYLYKPEANLEKLVYTVSACLQPVAV